MRSETTRTEVTFDTDVAHVEFKLRFSWLDANGTLLHEFLRELAEVLFLLFERHEEVGRHSALHLLDRSRRPGLEIGFFLLFIFFEILIKILPVRLVEIHW